MDKAGLLFRVVVLAVGAAACTNRGPCDGAVPPPDMSKTIDVSPDVACAIAVQKELAGGLTWTASDAASVGPADASFMVAADGSSAPSFAISQNGFAANSECTAACSYNYNECFLPTGYLEAYVGAGSTGGTSSRAEAGTGNAIGNTVHAGGSGCPDAASVTVTCTYSSAGFCE